MHPDNKYNCTMPEIRPDYKIAPKRKREDLMESLAKRPHIAPAPIPSPLPTSSTPTNVRFNPVSPAPLSSAMDASQKFREQIMQRQAMHQAQQANLAKQPGLDLGQQPQLFQQAQQIREKLAQHHQMHVKHEPTPGIYATASPVKQEPTQQATHASHAMTTAPTVINLDQHECKGCEAMCQKMASLVNALGANILSFLPAMVSFNLLL
jgi:hypothetical protein